VASKMTVIMLILFLAGVSFVYASQDRDPGYTVVSAGEPVELSTEPTDPAVWALVLSRLRARGEDDLMEAARLYDLMEAKAKKYGLRLRFVAAVVDAESAFRPAAVSRCGAVGLMQIMPCNYSWLGITDPTDPAQNLEGGCRYLSRLVAKYRGREDLALLNYNAGPRYARMAREHWPAESRGYIRRVTANERRLMAHVGSDSSSPASPVGRLLAGDAGRRSGGAGVVPQALQLRPIPGRTETAAIRGAGRERHHRGRYGQADARPGGAQDVRQLAGMARPGGHHPPCRLGILARPDSFGAGGEGVPGTLPET
jgi:hypothetical protein